MTGFHYFPLKAGERAVTKMPFVSQMYATNSPSEDCDTPPQDSISVRHRIFLHLPLVSTSAVTQTSSRGREQSANRLTYSTVRVTTVECEILPEVAVTVIV